MYMYTRRRNFRRALVILAVIVYAVFSIAVLSSHEDVNRIRDAEVYRITAINTDSFNVDIWQPNYWTKVAESTVVKGKNPEAKIGDFINNKLQIVDSKGNFLATVPEQNGQVFTVTDINKTDNLWWLVQGPRTYQAGEGATSMEISNSDIKVGDFINTKGQKVDMFGYLV